MSKALARLTKELAGLNGGEPIEGVSIALQGDDTAKWDVKIQGPQGTPYEGGVFMAFIDFSDNYPFKAPKAQFKTKIYHPNIKTDTGEICTAAIEGQWKPTLNARFVIESLVSLLVSPKPEDPLEPAIAEEFNSNRDTFNKKAAEFTATHAK